MLNKNELIASWWIYSHRASTSHLFSECLVPFTVRFIALKLMVRNDLKLRR
jgi:hypothetical protein